MVDLTPKSRGWLASLSGGARALGRAFSISGGSGYDAVKEKGRRQAPTGLVRSEDAELRVADRKKLVSGTRDLHRNFSIVAWMIRRHLDYISTFSFQCRSGNPEMDAQVEKLMRWWSRPGNCDVMGRFSLTRMARMAEMRRVIDGDVFPLKLRDGRIQWIEGDRVRTPIGGLPTDVVDFAAGDLLHGVRTDDAGMPLQYCICKRSKLTDTLGGTDNFTFERMVDARNLYQFGYFDRFDQVRGISPLASALNSLRDVYEGFDYALAKMKVAQLFGMSIFREKSDTFGTPPIAEEIETDPEDNDDNPEETETSYKVNFGSGPFLLDLDPGDRAEFLENKTPSIEFQQFSQVMIGVALKALDIPYSFYAENFTNYSGARQALLQYEQSAKVKREDVMAMLDHLTAWRIGLWIQDGVLDAEFSDIQWEWVHRGIGWIDPLKEIQANQAAVDGGFDTLTRIIKETTGRDFKDVADERAAELAYLKQVGVQTNTRPPIPIIEAVEVENAAA